MSARTFQQTNEEETEDAVTVRIFAVDGETVAEADWPRVSDGETIYGPALGNALPFPVALDVAEDAKRRFHFSKILIHIHDPSLWKEEWGSLTPPSA
ncbi:hypothetical protein SAMN02927900_01302 [Rhizobium mongolense subsp. loessense]|uniref:Uncharacterized protein n=1 Tax=Rhizobium mongolense subsp. loessense TaxID=158890 RepID=A0A1G4Q3W9_9HYPH|nr:hypothetical protein [Rhizobium mongolense]SCW39157.1 hypothetical protein SAMN02927900_01302 [Rhizobium mongolense subsp. loessense]